jgi:hypothetical protein
VSTWPGEELQVIIYQDGSGWVGRCLQIDISAQAQSCEQVGDEVQKALVDHIVAARLAGRTPFADLAPAPRRYWELFQDGVPLPVPSEFEIRMDPGVIMPVPTERRIA